VASYWGSDLLGPQQGTLRARAKMLVMSRLIRAHSLLLSATTTKSSEMESVLPPRARRRNRVIPDGVDRERFKPLDRAEARRRAGWPEGEVTVISVGRDVPLKRLWLAREATEIAAQQIAALRWRLLSDADPEDMPGYYNAAHCLIHTSASEGSPNVIKEALACDLPVVATPAGDIPELLDGVEGCAVCPPDPSELAQAICRSVSGDARSDGRARTERLGLDQIAARVLELYGELGLPENARAAPGVSVRSSAPS
jgi:glycosyltransferase involved in cell wall biosynthesis